ncbi:rhomboid family protein [Candidatus Vecturithrix granuli]|uniref:Rhomboid family protein n=1 Tax=Vecturithrix granuli TaxID=1499967 RepID=A0A081C0F7_VECG1|nr:rhomboid family protein [Candidatus Vecturithrix granuli]
MFGLPLFTVAIMILTVAVSLEGFYRPELVSKYWFEPKRILEHKEYYRLFTSALVHADVTHLAFNMFTLFSFGSKLEMAAPAGTFACALIYAASVLGGNLLALYLHRHHVYRALGASGGVCGSIFAAIMLFPGMSLYMFFIPVPIPASLYALLFVIFSVWGIRTRFGHIGHDAHLGGAMIGLLATAVFYPAVILRHLLLFCAILGVSGAGLAYLYQAPGFLPKSHGFSRTSWKGFWSKQKRRQQTKQWITDEEAIDRLLDKAIEFGMESLTDWERQELERLAQKRRKRQ